MGTEPSGGWLHYPKVTEVILRKSIKEQTCLTFHCAFLLLGDKLSVLPGIHLFCNIICWRSVCVCIHTYIYIVAIEVELLLCWLSLADKYSVEVSSYVHHPLGLSSWNWPLCVGTFMMHWNMEAFLIKFAIPQPTGGARKPSVILRSSWHCALAS